MLVKRNFVAVYKQTILGPAWFFIQPLITTLVFALIFGKAGNFSPETKSTFLFYLAGIILWQYFADCLKTYPKPFMTIKEFSVKYIFQD